MGYCYVVREKTSLDHLDPHIDLLDFVAAHKRDAVFPYVPQDRLTVGFDV
jgi:hypothetical protein